MKVKLPHLFPAFNPALVEAEKESGDTDALIKVTTGGNTVTLKRDFIGNKAIFNISDIVKKVFLNNTEPSSLINDKLLYTSVSIQYTSTQLVNPIYITNAINAVEQTGKSCSYSSQVGTFRTSLDKLICYEGYRRTISMLSLTRTTYVHFDSYIHKQPTHIIPRIFSLEIPEGCKRVTISPENNPVTYLVNSQGKHMVNHENNPIILSSGEEGVSSALTIENRCVPENPFYIRWINQMGGWDYWMFSFRQVMESKIKNQKIFNSNVYDTENSRGNSYEFYKEAEETITVGAEGLSDNEFECLRKIPYSHRIEYYEKETDRWFRLIPTESEIENDTRAGSKSVELTLQLPTPLLQI